MSTSDRRSGSSEPSKKRKSSRISTAPTTRQRHTGGAASHAKGSRSPSNGKGGGTPSAARLRAEQRKAEREARLAARRRSGRLVMAGAVAALLLVIVGCVALYTSPLFTITSVEVAGVRHLSVARVRSLADVPVDATLIRFPAEQVRRRVLSDPWVDSVAVSRVFPSGMRIRVTERAPIAVFEADGERWLIDEKAVVIARSSTTATGTAKITTEAVNAAKGLPVVRDLTGLDPRAGRKTSSEPLLNAVAVLRGISPSLAATVRAVSAPTIDGTTLLTASRVEIVFGEAVDLTVKDSLARRILREQRRRVISIDVRVIDRPTWRGLK